MTTTSQDLNALFKEVYRDKVENLVPEGIQLLKDVPFSEKEKVGESLQVAVRASDKNNFTFTNDAISAVRLQQPIPSRYLTASVRPTTVVLQAQLSYQQAAKAASKKKSIEEGTQEIFSSLKLSMERRLEDAFFNGSADIAPIDELKFTTDPEDADANPRIIMVAGTDIVRTFPTGTMLWPTDEDTERIKDTVVSITRGVNPFGRTGREGTLVASGLKIKSINADRLTITFDTTDATLILNHHVSNPTSSRTTRGDSFIFERQLPVDHSLLGLEQLLTTTSGALYGIQVDDPSGYWTPGAYAVGGKLTVDHIIKAAEVAVPNGLEGRACLYISTAAFANLALELDKNLQSFMGLEVPYSKGVVEVKPSIYVKTDKGYLIKPEDCKRIGTTAPTFNTPGLEQGPFHRMEGNNGFIITLYTEQALFISKPSRCVRLSGITT